MVGGRKVDHRSHERLRIGEGPVDDQPVDDFGDRVEQLALLAVLDDQTARRRAALAGGEVGGLDDHDRRRLDVLGVPDDQWIVTAELEREDLVRGFGELAVERLAGTGRSGEQKAIDPRLGGERLALRPDRRSAAGPRLRDLRLMEAVDEEFADRRGLL